MTKLSANCHLILNVLEKLPQPLSPQEIKVLVNKQESSDRATVYRSLKTLREKNYIRTVDFGDGVTRYESNNHHHHHLICVRCKNLTDIELSLQSEAFLTQLQNQYKQNYNFFFLEHSLEFHGLCQKCL